MEVVNNILEIVLVIGIVAVWFSFLKNLYKGVFGIDIIAGVALLSTFVAGQYIAGVVVLVMFTGGQFLEDYAMRRAKKELSLLLSRTPTIAHLKNGNNFIDTKLEDLKIGDVVLVKGSEIVSVDGVIVEGSSEINEAVLTGESVPVLKEVGGLVFAGSENIGNPVLIKVLKLSNNTKYNEILNLVKENENNKAKVVRLADEYSIYFTVITFAVAGLTWFLTTDFLRVISVLVVATPCPLLIATPVAIMSGMSRAYKRGVLFKNGLALETLSKVKHFVFDKTGTITFGNPIVCQIVSFSTYTESEILKIATSLGQPSTHIFAKAIIKYAQEKEVVLEKVLQDFKEDYGFGVSGKIDSVEYFLGKKTFLEAKDIHFSEEVEKQMGIANEKGQIVVFVSDKEKVLGLILFEDEVRPESKNIFEKFLSYKDLQLTLLTGDNSSKAKQVGEMLSVQNVVSGATPKDKLEYITTVQQKTFVAMVGDGVNDAPALTKADVGIALTNHERTVSSDVSDVVILSGNLSSVYEAYEISKNTVKLAKQGIVFGMGASFVAMIFSGFGFILPLSGAILQEGIDVVVILNALRL